MFVFLASRVWVLAGDVAKLKFSALSTAVPESDDVPY